MVISVIPIIHHHPNYTMPDILTLQLLGTGSHKSSWTFNWFWCLLSWDLNVVPQTCQDMERFFTMLTLFWNVLAILLSDVIPQTCLGFEIFWTLMTCLMMWLSWVSVMWFLRLDLNLKHFSNCCLCFAMSSWTLHVSLLDLWCMFCMWIFFPLNHFPQLGHFLPHY